VSGAPSSDAVPTAPYDVAAEVNGASAHVTWSTPKSSGSSSIVKYVVTASPGGARCTTTGATHCVVTGLHVGVDYTFSVVAYNQQGASRAGHTSATSSVSAPSAPRTTVVSVTNGVAQVSWTPPASDGGAPITRYVVTASPGGARCTTTGSTHCVVTGLHVGVDYTFSVVAYNRAGRSPAATANGVVLALPTVAINGGVAVASWRSPALSNRTTARYRVVLGPGGFGCSTVRVTICALGDVPNVARYHVSLELLATSGRVLSVVEGSVQEVFLLQTYFATDSYELAPAMKAKIAALAKELVTHREPDVTVFGHADRAGRLLDNLALSHERAQAVATYLYEQLQLLGDTSVRIHVVAGGVSTASSLYSLDRNAIVVTSAD
jgi:hypothetical protein